MVPIRIAPAVWLKSGGFSISAMVARGKGCGKAALLSQSMVRLYDRTILVIRTGIVGRH